MRDNGNDDRSYQDEADSEQQAKEQRNRGRHTREPPFYEMSCHKWRYLPPGRVPTLLWSMFLHVEEHEALQEHKKAPGRADQTSRRSLHAFAAIVPRRFLTEQDVTLGPGHDSSENK